MWEGETGMTEAGWRLDGHVLVGNNGAGLEEGNVTLSCPPLQGTLEKLTKSHEAIMSDCRG